MEQDLEIFIAITHYTPFFFDTHFFSCDWAFHGLVEWVGKDMKKRHSCEVSIEEIEKNGYNLNISRYVSTALEEEKIDLDEVHKRLDSINKRIKENRDKHNAYLKELGLDEIE